MRILRVINSLHTGGAERSLSVNVPQHIKNGYLTDVLLLDSTVTSFYEVLKEANVKIYSFNGRSIYNPLYIFKIRKYLRQYDIIHVHLFPALYWVAIAKLIFSTKAKLLFTEHATHNKRRDHRITRLLDRIIYRTYDKIIAISHETKVNLVQQIDVNPNKIIVIENGVDFAQLNNEARKHIDSIFMGKKILLQVASFRDAKDQDTLIRALSILPKEYVAIFVGDGYRLKACGDLAEKLGVANRVVFYGNSNSVGEFYNLAHITIISSHWEGFGRAAVESMSLKTPVLASNVKGLSQVVNNEDLLFSPGNENELAEKIMWLSSNSKIYEKYTSLCFEESKKYDAQKMIFKYEQLYDELLSHQKNSNP